NNNWGFGIYANAAGGGITITNNRLSNNNNNAIYIYNTDGVEISFNECWNNNNKDNIYLYLSDHSVVASNTVYDGKDVEGIYIDTCQSPDVNDNICFNLSFGIDLYASPDAVVTTNEVYETVYDGIIAIGCTDSSFNLNNIHDVGAYGMSIVDSDDSTINSNTFSNDGLYIGDDNAVDYKNYTVEANTVNGKQLGYFVSLDSAIYDSPIYGQLIIINASDSLITNQELSYTDIGLYLWGCADTIVNASDFSNDFLGIEIYECNYTFTEFNTLNNNVVGGVTILYSNETYVVYSDLNNNEAGVFAYYSPFTTINNNNIIGNSMDGIQLSDCPDSRIMGNFMENNGAEGLDGVPQFGVYIENSGNTTITTNNMLKNGFYISETSPSAYQSYDIEFNDVNSLPFGYFIDVDDFDITGATYGQLFFVNCSDFTVTDMNFDYSTVGVRLVYCNNSFLNNIASTNGRYGIEIDYSENIEIGLCVLNSNYIGLYVMDSKYLLIIENDFFYNIFDGATLHNVDNSTIAFNRAVMNDFNGIQLAFGEYNDFTYNLLQENTNYGIKLGLSDYNRIHHNTFLDNNLLGYNDGMFTLYAQGYDTKTTSLWYDDTINEGNWWSDWSGTGSYVLDGRLIGSNEDLYPLGTPTVPIFSEYTLNLMFLFPMIIIPIILISYRKKNRNS
ncbi:MAG: NosD domain-containing protein, partial [Candidatus Heimdallarchaeaceae archaeon]